MVATPDIRELPCLRLVGPSPAPTQARRARTVPQTDRAGHGRCASVFERGSRSQNGLKLAPRAHRDQPRRLHLVRAPDESAAPRAAADFPPTAGVVEAIDDDMCLLTVGAESMNAIVMHLGLLEYEFTVLAPAQLQSRVRNWPPASNAPPDGRKTECRDPFNPEHRGLSRPGRMLSAGPSRRPWVKGFVPRTGRVGGWPGLGAGASTGWPRCLCRRLRRAR